MGLEVFLEKPGILESAALLELAQWTERLTCERRESVFGLYRLQLQTSDFVFTPGSRRWLVPVAVRTPNVVSHQRHANLAVAPASCIGRGELNVQIVVRKLQQLFSEEVPVQDFVVVRRLQNRPLPRTFELGEVPRPRLVGGWIDDYPFKT